VDADRQDWDAMALVGRIARAHGNRGDVIVNPESDFPEARFRPGSVLTIRRGGRVEHLTIETARLQQGRPVLHFAGVDSMDAAEALAGLELKVAADALTALGDGQYYRHDLVGCRVETRSGTIVGTVQRVEGDAGQDRLVVEGPRGEVLIPMAAEICVRIDVGAAVIVIDPPAGLLELNEPGAGRG
jgi:16S rRNA processing protein RimM